MRPLRGRRGWACGSAGRALARCARPRATHGYSIDRSAVADHPASWGAKAVKRRRRESTRAHGVSRGYSAPFRSSPGGAKHESGLLSPLRGFSHSQSETHGLRHGLWCFRPYGTLPKEAADRPVAMKHGCALAPALRPFHSRGYAAGVRGSITSTAVADHGPPCSGPTTQVKRSFSWRSSAPQVASARILARVRTRSPGRVARQGRTNAAGRFARGRTNANGRAARQGRRSFPEESVETGRFSVKSGPRPDKCCGKIRPRPDQSPRTRKSQNPRHDPWVLALDQRVLFDGAGYPP